MSVEKWQAGAYKVKLKQYNYLCFLLHSLFLDFFFLFFENMIWQRLCTVAGIQTIHSQPLSFFPLMKKTYFSLYIRSKPRNGLEHVYKCPFPQGSRGLMPWAAGGIFSALVLLMKFWLQLWGWGCSDKLWTCTLLTTHYLPSPLLSVPVQWIWSQANPFGDDNIWGGSIFSIRFFTFQVFFLHEHRREGEKGASAGQLIGHCCQSNVGVTAVKVLTSSDLWRHPSIQPRAREGSQSWL